MAIQNTAFTPARRGPFLRDGAGGTSERVSAREVDPVLRNVGHLTEDIRLTAAGTDQDGGDGVFYNFGKPTRQSVGRYLFKAQSATGAGEPLGAFEMVEAEIREATAGVFVIDRVDQLEGLIAAQDATQTRTNLDDDDLDMDTDAVSYATTGGDGNVGIIVVTAQQETDLVASGYAVAQGDLIILEVRSTTQEVWSCYRMS